MLPLHSIFIALSHAYSVLYVQLHTLSFLSVAVRMLLSVLLAGAVGLNREDMNRPAGLRTHVLVCLGTAFAMITSEYMFVRYGKIIDPSRIGAQVVSGIGFLGAGTIIISGKHVRGLTTAAGLWATACLGLLIGCGFYSAALLGCAAILLTLIALRKFSFLMRRRSCNLQLFIELESPDSFGVLLNYFKIKSAQVRDLERSEVSLGKMQSLDVLVTLHLPTHNEHDVFLQELEKLPFVIFIIEQE